MQIVLHISKAPITRPPSVVPLQHRINDARDDDDLNVSGARPLNAASVLESSTVMVRGPKSLAENDDVDADKVDAAYTRGNIMPAPRRPLKPTYFAIRIHPETRF